ncbi:MAG TPA: type II toxin-antitoxin system VapC family toxin [Oceanospirillales bacterium]|nr:type II toxin-antitoxin system VapC family toxin [Oceanospirillales bacterium]
MYILDTNVISELRKAKTLNADPNVVQWASSIELPLLFISVITVMELEMGVLLIERKDKIQGQMLRHWLESHVLKAFENRILPINTQTAQCCAKLHVPNPRSDRDALIAATGMVNKMTVVTRNINDFKLTKVALINPWVGE